MKRRRDKLSAAEREAQDQQLATLLDEFEEEHNAPPQPVVFVKPHGKSPQSFRPAQQRTAESSSSSFHATTFAVPVPPSLAVPAGFAFDHASGFYYNAERSCYLQPACNATAGRDLYCDTVACSWSYFDANARAYRPFPTDNLSEPQRALLARIAPTTAATAVLDRSAVTAAEDCVAAIEALMGAADNAVANVDHGGVGRGGDGGSSGGDASGGGEKADTSAGAPEENKPLPDRTARAAVSFKSSLSGSSKQKGGIKGSRSVVSARPAFDSSLEGDPHEEGGA